MTADRLHPNDKVRVYLYWGGKDIGATEVLVSTRLRRLSIKPSTARSTPAQTSKTMYSA